MGCLVVRPPRGHLTPPEKQVTPHSSSKNAIAGMTADVYHTKPFALEVQP